MIPVFSHSSKSYIRAVRWTLGALKTPVQGGYGNIVCPFIVPFITDMRGKERAHRIEGWMLRARGSTGESDQKANHDGIVSHGTLRSTNVRGNGRPY
jgi:hypothetical protein